MAGIALFHIMSRLCTLGKYSLIVEIKPANVTSSGCMYLPGGLGFFTPPAVPPKFERESTRSSDTIGVTRPVRLAITPEASFHKSLK